MRRQTTIDTSDDRAIVDTAQAVGAAVITLAIIAVVANAVLTTSALETDKKVTNESVTVDYNNLVSVDEGHGSDTTYLDNEVVYSQSGSQLTEGTDYEWYTSNGSVEFFNTSATTSGNIAEITYEYERTGGFFAVIGSLQTTGVAAMSLLVVALLVIASNAILARFGRGF